MSSQPKPSLANLLESFFRQRLIAQRNASPDTVAAYRDTLRLFLTFTSERQGKLPSKLVLEDLDRDAVLTFLDHLEHKRGNSVSTRNARLAGIRSFFQHVALSDPASAGIAGRVLNIPSKRTTKRMVGYLVQQELDALLAAPDLATPLGRRDHALILFLAQTGARVSEACGVMVADLQLSWPSQVQLRGKGRKERAIPLSKDTAKHLQALCDERGLPTRSQAPLFVNSRRQRLTRHGVTHILKRAATKTAPELARTSVSPHRLRHTLAMSLLSSDVDLTTIQSWLGHASINTTHRYAEANMEMKRRALEKCRTSETAPTAPTRYDPPDEVLAFLESLCKADLSTQP